MEGSQPLLDLPTFNRAGLFLMPIRKVKRTIVILSLALASCRSPAPVSPTPEVIPLRMLTDNATMPLFSDLASSYRPSRILITWDARSSEVNTVLDWLRADEAPYVMLDYQPDFSSDLWVTPIAQDGIAIVVHPSNPAASLTAAQLRAVLQGQVANWKDLGGADIPLTVVARNDSSSTARLIQSMVLGDRRTTRAARLATTSQAVIDLVGADVGAIGYVSMGYLSTGVKALALDNVLPTPDAVTAHQYPLRTPIVIAGIHAPGNDVYREFFAWIQSPEGQTVVRRRYGGLAAK
ncbi:MAG: substrate-binding domain-containing protein [Anaerolineae bacterium]|nr:substrate-binding domain-containing protein [Anaerolineae bacterium]